MSATEQAVPTVIYVHGVGMWPGLFDEVAQVVTTGTGFRSHVWTRPGYDAQSDGSSLREQVAVLHELISEHAPAYVVGVGAGATLALACAIDGPRGLAGIVTHEPCIGALAPELDQRARQAGDELLRWPSRSRSFDFLAGLYGQQSWGTMPAAGHDWAGDHYAAVCSEARQFAMFQPTLEQVRDIPVPHLTTVGQNSNQDHQNVASMLWDFGASSGVIENCGHLVVLDQPAEFATGINNFLAPGVNA